MPLSKGRIAYPRPDRRRESIDRAFEIISLATQQNQVERRP